MFVCELAGVAKDATIKIKASSKTEFTKAVKKLKKANKNLKTARFVKA